MPASASGEGNGTPGAAVAPAPLKPVPTFLGVFAPGFIVTASGLEMPTKFCNASLVISC